MSEENITNDETQPVQTQAPAKAPKAKKASKPTAETPTPPPQEIPQDAVKEEAVVPVDVLNEDTSKEQQDVPKVEPDAEVIPQKPTGASALVDAIVDKPTIVDKPNVEPPVTVAKVDNVESLTEDEMPPISHKITVIYDERDTKINEAIVEKLKLYRFHTWSKNLQNVIRTDIHNLLLQFSPYISIRRFELASVDGSLILNLSYKHGDVDNPSLIDREYRLQKVQ